MEGFYYRPRVDREFLEQFHEGLIAILPSFGGEHAHAIKDGATDRAKESLAYYKKLYGDDCYAEITHHPEIEGHEERMRKIIDTCRRAEIPARRGARYVLFEARRQHRARARHQDQDRRNVEP